MEPTLESISDYNELKGEKKKTVWTVIIVGLVIGFAYLIASKVFEAKDELPVQEKIVTMPYGTTAMPIK